MTLGNFLQPLFMTLLSLCKPGILPLPGPLQIGAAFLTVERGNIVLSEAKRTACQQGRAAFVTEFIRASIDGVAPGAHQLTALGPIRQDNSGTTGGAAERSIGVDVCIQRGAAGGAIERIDLHKFKIPR